MKDGRWSIAKNVRMFAKRDKLQVQNGTLFLDPGCAVVPLVATLSRVTVSADHGVSFTRGQTETRVVPCRTNACGFWRLFLHRTEQNRNSTQFSVLFCYIFHVVLTRVRASQAWCVAGQRLTARVLVRREVACLGVRASCGATRVYQLHSHLSPPRVHRSASHNHQLSNSTLRRLSRTSPQTDRQRQHEHMWGQDAVFLMWLHEREHAE